MSNSAQFSDAVPLSARAALRRHLVLGRSQPWSPSAKDVMTCIKKLGCEKDFPLFCAIHKIAFEGAKPESIVDLYK